VWKVFADMAKCVQHVQARNFVHLDIKPSNFFVTESHHVKLGDFGSAIDLLKVSNLPDND